MIVVRNYSVWLYLYYTIALVDNIILPRYNYYVYRRGRAVGGKRKSDVAGIKPVIWY